MCRLINWNLSINHITIMWHIHASIMLYPCIHYFHSVSYGYILRCYIRISDNRTYFRCIQYFKRILFTSFCRLSGIPIMPVWPLKKITYFKYLRIFPWLPSKQLPINQNSIFDNGQLPVKPFMGFIVTKCTLICVHCIFILQDFTQRLKIILIHLTQI